MFPVLVSSCFSDSEDLAASAHGNATKNKVLIHTLFTPTPHASRLTPHASRLTSSCMHTNADWLAAQGIEII